MRIIGHLRALGQRRGGGVETFLAVMRALRERGHEAQIIVPSRPHGGDPGVPVRIVNGDAARFYHNADVILTQRQIGLEPARQSKRRVVYFVHNRGQPACYGYTPAEVALVVYNAAWVRKASPWPGPSVVLNPPVFADHYRTMSGDCITLVNLGAHKGAELFYRLAERMPDRRFLGVVGAWGHQIIRRLPNVTIQPHTRDMRSVYGRTRILLMPSQHPETGWTESWGRCGVEAAASGIPTLAHPTPGCLDSLGRAGTFLDRDDPDAWVAEIRRLDDAALYARQSAAALRRSKELDPTPQMNALEAVLRRLAA